MSDDKSTVREAAEKLQVHYQTVRNMINDGRLKAEKTEGGGAWLVDNASIRKNQLEYAEKTILNEEEDATINSLKLIADSNHERAFEAVSELAKISKGFSSYYENEDLSISIVQGVTDRMKKEIETFEIALKVIESVKKLEDSIKSKEKTDRNDFHDKTKDGVEK